MSQVQTNAVSERKPLTILSAQETQEKVLGPKALDELREILRNDEDVREFFLLLKNRELRKSAIEKLNAHITRRQ